MSIQSSHHAVAESARLKRHFDEVIAELRVRDTRDLSPAQRELRAHHVAELEAYRDAGVFPINTRFPASVEPSFVDDFGTRCAMAHLVEATGATAVVDRIAGTMNHARIMEMVGDTDLAAWLEQNGLSWEEAARIQPGYPPRPLPECFCPPTGALTDTILETKVVDNAGPAIHPMTLEITAVHGNTTVYAVGEHVQVEGGFPVSTPLLAYFGPGVERPSILALALNTDGTVSCRGPFAPPGDLPGGSGSAYESIGACVALGKEESIAFALSPGCHEDLAMVFAQTQDCPEGGGAGVGSTSGSGEPMPASDSCSVAAVGIASGSLLTLAPVLVLLIALARRTSR